MPERSWEKAFRNAKYLKCIKVFIFTFFFGDFILQYTIGYFWGGIDYTVEGEDKHDIKSDITIYN